jgi:Bacterial Ig-like domain (group 1)
MRRFITLLVVVAGIAAAAAAPASASSLEFEYLLGTDFTLQDLQCNPEGTSSATVLVSGDAGGPHPGTFEATLTLTGGSQQFGEGQLLTLNETFEIDSGDTVASGTKRLVPRQERFYTFTCGVTPSGDCEDVFVRASAPVEDALRYEATITDPEGTQQERGYTEFAFGFRGLRCGGEWQFTEGGMDQFFTLVVSPNDPATVVLAPATAVTVVDSEHEVTATVTDASGQPLFGAIVRFSVAGTTTASGDCMTDGNGECRFLYQVGEFPGDDTISAYADVNADGVQDPLEPTRTATNTVVLPGSTPGRTTGDGKFLDDFFFDPHEVTFSLNARSDGTTLRGNCTINDKSTDTTLKCLDVLAYVQHGSEARFYGHAEQNGIATLYRIRVEDNGRPGSSPADFISIQTAAGDSAGGPVTSGDIEVR